MAQLSGVDHATLAAFAQRTHDIRLRAQQLAQQEGLVLEQGVKLNLVAGPVAEQIARPPLDLQHALLHQQRDRPSSSAAAGTSATAGTSSVAGVSGAAAGLALPALLAAAEAVGGGGFLPGDAGDSFLPEGRQGAQLPQGEEQGQEQPKQQG